MAIKSEWGPWRLHSENLTLSFEPNGYYFDLEKGQSSAVLLDWIFQLSGKVWCTPEVMEEYLLALRDLFEPQANLCSFGTDSKIIPDKDFFDKNLSVRAELKRRMRTR